MEVGIDLPTALLEPSRWLLPLAMLRPGNVDHMRPDTQKTVLHARLLQLIQMLEGFFC